MGALVGKLINLFKSPEPDPDLHWSRGYSDGYRSIRARLNQPREYYTGYVIGDTDRYEDEQALETGDYDPLTDNERLAIYGDESDKP